MASPLPTAIKGKSGGVAEVTGSSLNVAVTSMPSITVDPPVGGATEAKQDTGNTSLATLAAAVAGTEVQVDVKSVPTAGGQTVLHKAIDIAAATTTPIVGADATKKIKVLSYLLFSAGTNTVTIKTGITKLSGDFAMTTGLTIGMSGSILAPVFETAVNEALNITTTGTPQLSGHITYILEA